MESLSTSNILNFSPGPSSIPNDVLLELRDELTSYKESGMTFFENSHRNKLFIEYFEDFKEKISNYLSIPSDYRLVIMHGGASQQFANIYFNFATPTNLPSYIVSGYWSKKAHENASKSKIIYSNGPSYKEFNYDFLNDFPLNSSYLHYVYNETIDGLRLGISLQYGVPIIADVSSSLFGEHIPIKQFDMLYSSSQKHLCIPGFSIIIIKEDFLHSCNTDCPSIYNYLSNFNENSIACTPNTFSIYMCSKIISHFNSRGGLQYYDLMNKKKSSLLYDCIDNSNIFECFVNNKELRSVVNIPFFLKKSKIDELFFQQAEREGFLNLKGHPSKGGIRINLYNAITYDNVESFVEFLHYFDNLHS